MKPSVFWLAVCISVAVIACGDSGTGSMVFVAEELSVTGNPSILGESGSAEGPGNYITIDGFVDSRLGIGLTGLRVRVRVLDANRAEIGVREEPCSPSSINPGGSCTFHLGVSLGATLFTDSREIEITPISDQGIGTVRAIPVLWQSS